MWVQSLSLVEHHMLFGVENSPCKGTSPTRTGPTPTDVQIPRESQECHSGTMTSHCPLNVFRANPKNVNSSPEAWRIRDSELSRLKADRYQRTLYIQAILTSSIALMTRYQLQKIKFIRWSHRHIKRERPSDCVYSEAQSSWRRRYL